MATADTPLGPAWIPRLREMALTMLIADQASKSLHEARIVGRIVMTAARRAEIFVRGNTRSAQRGSSGNFVQPAPTNVPNSPNSVRAVIEARLRDGKALNRRVLIV
jgi:hypothetical protein